MALPSQQPAANPAVSVSAPVTGTGAFQLAYRLSHWALGHEASIDSCTRWSRILMRRHSREELQELNRRVEEIMQDPHAAMQVEQMRASGCSRWQLLRYAAANAVPDATDQPVRQECFQQAISLQGQNREKHLATTALMAATPVVFLGSFIAWGIVGVTAGMSVVMPEALDVLKQMGQTTFSWVQWAADLNPVMIAAATGTGLLGWKAAKTPRATLEERLREVDPQLARGQENTQEVYAELGKIPQNARCLLEHLPGLELRAFLASSEVQRRDILQQSPPPTNAYIRYILASSPISIPGAVRVVRDMLGLAQDHFSLMQKDEPLHQGIAQKRLEALRPNAALPAALPARPATP